MYVYLKKKYNLQGLIGHHEGCTWVVSNSSDWIYMTSSIIVLAVNVIFLIMIMWVSILFTVLSISIWFSLTSLVHVFQTMERATLEI